MKNTIKKPLLFVLVFLPVALVGGLFTGIYSYSAYTPEMQKLILEQLGSYELFVMVSAIQSVAFASICGFFGYILAVKTGLLKPFRLEKNKLGKTLVLTIISGIIFGMDYWLFGAFIPEVAEVYEATLTASNFIASVLYGGIVEEILMRLFAMTLSVFILWKLFFKDKSKEQIPIGVFTAANIVAALLFAAGHLPATSAAFDLTPFVILRCFLMNGGLGIVFGWLYRKYGIQYAMLGHMGCHIISKAIWLIFI